MPKTTSTERDLEAAQANASNVLRHVIEATEGTPVAPIQDSRNAAAVALGKLGASKGGKARAKSLTPKERTVIAKAAAAARWKNH